MITEIIEFAGFDGHLVPICISARNSRLHGDGCFDLLDKLEFGWQCRQTIRNRLGRKAHLP